MGKGSESTKNRFDKPTEEIGDYGKEGDSGSKGEMGKKGKNCEEECLIARRR